jgi:hypothetical protein
MVQEQRQDFDKLDALHVLAKLDQNFVVLIPRLQKSRCRGTLVYMHLGKG